MREGERERLTLTCCRKLDERQEKMEVESGMKLKATKKKKKGKTIHSLNTVGVMTVKPLEQKKRGRGR